MLWRAGRTHQVEPGLGRWKVRSGTFHAKWAWSMFRDWRIDPRVFFQLMPSFQLEILSYKSFPLSCFLNHLTMLPSHFYFQPKRNVVNYQSHFLLQVATNTVPFAKTWGVLNRAGKHTPHHHPCTVLSFAKTWQQVLPLRENRFLPSIQ